MVRLGWYPGCQLKHSCASAVLFLDCCVLELGCGSAGVVAGSPDTTPAEPHPNSSTQ